MLSLADRQIGDAWFFVHDERCHAFFLTCDRRLPRHHHWDIGHAVSDDLRHWTERPLALRGRPGAWDHNLATGSVVSRGGSFWMLYTGHAARSVGVARSDDLDRWHRVGDRPVSELDPTWYEAVSHGSRAHTHWRDPCMFEVDGRVWHGVCASRPDRSAGRRGTVGLAVSDDMRRWQVRPPLDVEPVCEEMECPQVLRRGGRWLLVFSTHPRFFADELKRAHPALAARSATYCMVAEAPFGPYRFVSAGPIVPAEYPMQPYGAQVVSWRGRDYLIGSVGDTLCDPIAIEPTDRGFVLAG